MTFNVTSLRHIEYDTFRFRLQVEMIGISADDDEEEDEKEEDGEEE